MIYLLDSNTYIQAKNLYYNMDFCPAYWDWLDHEFETGRLFSITSVYDELISPKDELADWVNERQGHFESVTDDDTQEMFSEIVEYVYGLPDKNPVHVDNFLDKADPWIIAKAISKKAIIVTHERLDPPNSKKVKIPNIAQNFSVACMSTFSLLKELEAKFILHGA